MIGQPTQPRASPGPAAGSRSRRCAAWQCAPGPRSRSSNLDGTDSLRACSSSPQLEGPAQCGATESPYTSTSLQLGRFAGAGHPQSVWLRTDRPLESYLLDLAGLPPPLPPGSVGGAGASHADCDGRLITADVKPHTSAGALLLQVRFNLIAPDPARLAPPETTLRPPRVLAGGGAKVARHSRRGVQPRESRPDGSPRWPLPELRRLQRSRRPPRSASERARRAWRCDRTPRR
jgi:hypothetical protein